MTAYGAVSGGTIATDHQRSWLTDLRPSRPARATSGTNSWTITCSGGQCNFLAAANCRLDSGETIDITGSTTATLTVTKRGDNICKNPWSYFTPAVAAATLNVGVTGNSNEVVIGEFFGGYARELTRGTKPGGRRTKEYRTTTPENWSSIPGYSPRQNRFRKSFDVTVTKAQYEAIQLWEEQTYNGTLPSVIVPDLAVNDCFVVKFLGFEFDKQNPDTYNITLNFLELARKEWTT